MSNTFYFIALVDNRKSLTVIDLDYCVEYERSDWNVIDGINYTDVKEAIQRARDLAVLNGLNYKPFESRYGEENEPKLQHY